MSEVRFTYVQTDRGYSKYITPAYPNRTINTTVVQESSVIDTSIEDAIYNPGSSYLWVNEHLHLNREQVKEMIHLMQHWLDTGRLPTP